MHDASVKFEVSNIPVSSMSLDALIVESDALKVEMTKIETRLSEKRAWDEAGDTSSPVSFKQWLPKVRKFQSLLNQRYIQVKNALKALRRAQNRPSKAKSK